MQLVASGCGERWSGDPLVGRVCDDTHIRFSAGAGIVKLHSIVVYDAAGPFSCCGVLGVIERCEPFAGIEHGAAYGQAVGLLLSGSVEICYVKVAAVCAKSARIERNFNDKSVFGCDSSFSCAEREPFGNGYGCNSERCASPVCYRVFFVDGGLVELAECERCRFVFIRTV